MASRHAFQVYPYDFRHPEPEFSGYQDRGHIRGPNACSQASKRAVGGGMGIGCHQNHAGIHQARLRHNLMADTRIDVKMMGKSLLLPEQAHLPVVAGRLNGGGGRIVVKHKGRLVPVPYLLASHLPEGIDGLEIQVVNLRKINVGRYDFPADHPVTAAVLCQYLLYRMHILFSCPAFFSCPAYMILNLSNTL